MSEEARKATREDAKKFGEANRAEGGDGWQLMADFANDHADHTAAIREKALALLARLAKVFTDCEGLAYGRLLFTEKPYSELAVDFALSLFQWKDVAEGLPEVDGLYLVRYAGGPRGYYLEPFETTKSPNLQWTTVAAYIPHPIPPYEKEQSND